MPRTIPQVENDTLLAGSRGAEPAIAVGSPAWFAWLETATAFAFTSPFGSFTARRERASSGRGGWYWRAEQRRGKVRRRAYLGKAAELTPERLRAVAASFADVQLPGNLTTHEAGGAYRSGGAEPAPASLPSGTVTFLFTDIVGSTQLWEQHPHAMPAALSRHDALLAQAFTAHGGIIFKTAGDSAHAVFMRARDALAAALAAQRAFHKEPWALPSPLRVRMALHTGAAEPRNGDYVRPLLNRLARLLDLGHGGQILLSRATHNLLADELPAQTSLRALGEHQLKDLTRPEPIFQCISPDLPSDFPPLRAGVPTASERAPAAPLLATKLYVPRARPTLIARPRLLDRLSAGLAQSRCTLLSASAGAGKTSLLATWLATIARPIAWVSLDERDQDAYQVLRYLIAALQMIAPACGRTALAWLNSSAPAPIEYILTDLVNDLAALPEPSLLVLDDYHLVRAPAIHTALAFLLDHLPPALHMVVATREDPPLPLARLRARGQLAELRAADLRFTAQEATEFLDAGMSLRLADEQVSALLARTEGWAAGLQLAGLALRDRPDPAGFVAAFAGSHRLVADYLMAEVIGSQPMATRHFLLTSSVLDRLCAPLCDALLGVETSERSNAPTRHSQLILEQLERANLFLVPLDDEGRWYRYHHLFADALRARLARELGPSAAAALHHQASHWFEQQGLLPEAVQHALAAGDGTLAARLIVPLARPMQQRGEMTTLLGWLAALPEAELRARPQLGMIYAWGLATTGQLLAAERWLPDADHALTAPEHSALRGEVSVIRARIALLQGDFPRTLQLARQALDYLPSDQLLLRALTHVSLGSACIGAGDLDAASQSFGQASALYQMIGQPIQALLPLRQLARVQLAQGRLNQLSQTTQEALRLAGKAGQRSPLVGYTYVSLGELLYERNDLAGASSYFADGRALVEQGGTGEVLNLMNLVDAYLGQARIRQAQGDLMGALELVSQIEPIWRTLAGSFQQRGPTSREGQAEPSLPRLGIAAIYMDLIATFRVRLWLDQGDIESASQWSQTIEWSQIDAIGLVQETPLIALARVLLAQGAYERALAVLARLLNFCEAVGRIGRVIELLALQALALRAHGRDLDALAALERALGKAEPEGFIRTFVDLGAPMAALLRSAETHSIQPGYVARLLAALPGELRAEHEQVNSPASARPQLLTLNAQLREPLTARELTILRLLASGASNAEIARQLIVEQSTVKTHLIHLYGKLDVHSRAQAVARARALQLLD